MAAHSKIGASSAYRWQACPGSVRLSEGIESKTSVHAEEGILAHDIASKILEHQPYGAVDPEMLEAIQVYISTVRADWEQVGDGEMFVEHRFDLSKLHPGLFGTADCVITDHDEGIVRVYDFKYGAGIPVEVVEDGKPNLQLTYYGLGALMTVGARARDIELVIVQPRCGHPDGPVRRHQFSTIELIDFAADLIEAARRTEDPDAPLVAGDHCRFCPAAGVCPELQKKALTIAQAEFAPHLSYDPEALSRTLEWLPTVEAWVKNVREFAYREAEHGRVPPGWKLVQKRATRKWMDEEKVMARLMGCVDTDATKLVEHKLKSVAQFEKALGRKRLEEVFADLISQESSGLALAHESDPREPVSLDAGQEFLKADFKELI